jgi:hypothetical protein
MDLLMYRDGFWPYDSTAQSRPSEDVFPWDALLQVGLAAHNRKLPVVIPLNPRLYLQPRAMGRWLRRYAKAAGRPATAPERLFLEEARQPHPNIGQREWLIHIDELTSPEEILTNLVVGARQLEFPTAQEDEAIAVQWIQTVIRAGFHRWSIKKAVCQEWATELVGDVFAALIDRFDIPASAKSLRNYTMETALGLKRDELKATSPLRAEPYSDPASGHRVYPDTWVAQDGHIHVKTVQRWRESHDITTPGLSEEQLEVFRQEQVPKQEKKRLRELGKRLGMMKEAVEKTLKRCLEKGKSEQDITAILQRNAARQLRRRQNGKVTGFTVDDIDAAIAELHDRLQEENLTETEHEDMLRKVQELRQLRPRQYGPEQ